MSQAEKKLKKKKNLSKLDLHNKELEGKWRGARNRKAKELKVWEEFVGI